MSDGNHSSDTSRTAETIPDHLLIGYGGRLAVKESGQSVLTGSTNILEYVSEFKKKHALPADKAQPALKLMSFCGVPQEMVHRQIISVLVTNLEKKILSMTQEELSHLLSKSYSYLTVPELRPIATSVLERMESVPPSIWREIVDCGLTESPYADLPHTLKRRIWTAIPSAFLFELDNLLDGLPAHREPTTLESALALKPPAALRAGDKLLQRLHELVSDTDDRLVHFIDHMVDLFASAASAVRRLSLANLLHDVLCVVGPRRLPNIEKLRSMARLLDSGCAAGDERAPGVASCVREMRESMSDQAACGPVLLLVSSTRAREAVVTQLVAALEGARKRLPERAEPKDFAATFERRKHELLRDAFLRDLTYIVLCNVYAGALINASQPLGDERVEEYYGHFVPLMTHEMAVDKAQMMDGFEKEHANVPHPELFQGAQKDAFQRRVLVHYVLKLMMRKNMTGVSKYRLVLDKCVLHCDPVEEAKEAVIAHGIISHFLNM